jgi:hypothetical protein
MFYRKLEARIVELAQAYLPVRLVRKPQSRQAWREFYTPRVLGCLGLALAIVVWGYGYRLSVYQPHRDPASRTLSAKLWLDQRHTVSASDSQQNASSAAAEPSPLHSFHLICVCTLVIWPVRVRSVRSSKSLLPLRSPPSASFSA